MPKQKGDDSEKCRKIKTEDESDDESIPPLEDASDVDQ